VRVVWSPLAELRAAEVVEWIAQHRPGTAADWLDTLLMRVAALDRFAKRGRIVPEIGKPEYRQLHHHPCRVIYRVDARQVVILTIRHGRRDWDPSEIDRRAE
jgi:plasmid stabilization system protein ParE